ncbi:hypothetical protein [Sediminitomix flava]|uniref:Uncharacterized protein n=1 Tax=Sediminitomix flava TaxID=379075 RepID=A0A315Z7U6_SEDFL|nr:hypothetical protein [Sediminitomix flava]PWJ39995.1 hypothetical protein BC781_10558 [Sediminitomix flava]
MKDILLKSIGIAFVVGLAQWVFPWWGTASVAAATFALIYVNQTATKAFLSGFVGVGILWFAYAYYLDSNNASILSTKIGELFQLPNYQYLFLITAVFGGLLGGLSSLTGFSLRKLF